MKKYMILDLIQEKPRTRWELQMLTDLCDREVRRNIQELRAEGFPICSSSRSKGYWMGDKEDLRGMIAENLARANQLERIAQIQSEKLGDVW